MRVLFATTLIPRSDRSGGELVSLALIEALRALGHTTVTAGYLRPGSGPGDDASIVVEYRPVETAASGARAAFWLGQSVLRGLPYTSAKYQSRRYAAIVADLCARGQVDAVVIDHTQMFWLQRVVPDHVPIVLMMHNAESDLYARGAARGESLLHQFLYRREARLLRQIEVLAGARADRIWTLSAADAARAGRQTTCAVSALPVMPAWRDTTSVAPRFDIGLLGTWTWQPNADALRWFLSEVVPQLPASTSIGVAGSGADWVRGQDSRVTYLGFVDDAQAFLGASRVVAVPTRYGSGVETKMFAAIATGRPVVATSTATRALDDLPDTVRVADDAASFVEAIAVQRSAALHAAGLQQAKTWWQGRRSAFLECLEAEMSALASAMSDPPRSAVSGIREAARDFA